MDEQIPDDFEPHPEDQAIEAMAAADQHPKKAKKTVPAAPAGNPKRDAARARAKLLMDRRANERG